MRWRRSGDRQERRTSAAPEREETGIKGMKLFGNKKHYKHVKPRISAQSEKVLQDIDDTRELSGSYSAAAKAVRETAAAEENVKKRGRAWIVIVVIVALIAALVVGYLIWRKPPDVQPGGIITPQPGTDTNPDPAVTPSAPPVTDVTPGPDVTPAPDDPATENDMYFENGRKKGTYSFYVLGCDNAHGNTDTILYVLFDTVDETLNVVSIPRDTVINTSSEYKRINTVYNFNGLEGMRKQISNLLGYEIDENYAVIDLEAFVKIVDCIGGVDYVVPVDMYYDAPDEGLHIAIDKGYHHLYGEEALKVVRFRSGYANADLGRINTQQDFLMTVAKQLLKLRNIPNLPQLYDIFENYVDTNLTKANMAYFVEKFLLMDPENIHFHTIPGNGQMVRSGAYYFINKNDWLSIVNEGLNPFNVDIANENMNYLVYQSGDVYTNRGDYYGTSSFLDYKAAIAQYYAEDE